MQQLALRATVFEGSTIEFSRRRQWRVSYRLRSDSVFSCEAESIVGGHDSLIRATARTVCNPFQPQRYTGNARWGKLGGHHLSDRSTLLDTSRYIPADNRFSPPAAAHMTFVSAFIRV